MEIIRCPNQYRARARVVDSLNSKDMIILQGSYSSGKTTIVNLLVPFLRRNGYVIVLIHATQYSFHGSLQSVVVNALGLPQWVRTASLKVMYSVISDLVACGKTLLLVVDDFDTLLSGPLSNNLRICHSICALAQHSGKMKILATVYRLDLVVDSIKHLPGAKNYSISSIDIWRFDQDFERFVYKLARSYRIQPYQISSQSFMCKLYERSNGSTGVVINIFKVLANSKALVGGRVATGDTLSNIWRY